MSTIELSQHERTVDSGRQHFLWLFAGIFMIEWIALAITPFDRQDWAPKTVLLAGIYRINARSFHQSPFLR